MSGVSRGPRGQRMATSVSHWLRVYGMTRNGRGFSKSSVLMGADVRHRLAYSSTALKFREAPSTSGTLTCFHSTIFQFSATLAYLPHLLRCAIYLAWH